MASTDKHIQLFFNGELLADTKRAWRVLETSYPPVYYLSPEDIEMEYLALAAGSSWCEWKGQAVYYDVVHGEKLAEKAAWSFESAAGTVATGGPLNEHDVLFCNPCLMLQAE